MICGLLFVITLLYIVFVDNGLKSAGIGGLILSLIPPFIATVLGYIVKEKYFKPISSIQGISELHVQVQEADQTTAIQIDDTEELKPQETTPLL